MAATEKDATEMLEQAMGDNRNDGDSLPPEMLIKHPLQNRWTLWFFRNSKTKTWEENLCEITSFDTVEDFWALYNHIEVASKLQMGCDYSLFKHGIKPMWEDEKNKRGGRWLVNLTKNQRPQEIDTFWMETVLCLIGEAFDEQSDEICGAVINIRPRGHKISIWTSDYKKEEAIKRIGRKLKDRLNIPENITIGFQSHEDTASKSSSSAKNRFIV